jgi:AraC-like DNA-binding protein
MSYIAGIVLTFFLSILLLTKKSKTKADQILVVWLITIGIHLLFFFSNFANRILEYPYLLGLNFPFPLLHGPFLFLYTGAITNQLPPTKYRVLHFVPVVMMYCLFLPFFFLPVNEKVFIYQNEGEGHETQMMILIISIIISGVVYVLLSLHLLNKHKRTIRNYFSSAEKINLAWLRYLVYGIGVTWLFVIFADDVFIFNAVVVFVFFLGYFGIKQVGIFAQVLPESDTKELKLTSTNTTETATESSAGKYLRSGLNEAAAKDIHMALTKTVNENKLFTNSDLTLTDLAKALAVHPNNLSQVINTYERKTFYDYINTLRVEEFKRLAALPESQKFTLLGLAHDCGFNSKTSFNRNFKNSTGQSPSEYLAQISHEINA